MTAEPDLLPLDMPRRFEFTRQELRALARDYARTNVAHATAAKDAEIEALRAEVALLRVGAENERLHQRGLLDRERERAERLTEALRAFPAEPNPYTYRIAHAKARAALDQETTNG